jgi:hypothetical protein
MYDFWMSMELEEEERLFFVPLRELYSSIY